LGAVLSRLAGRLVTGPVAFAVAGVTDVLAFVIASLWFRTKQRLAGRAPISAGRRAAG
jgi:hypothetical protein